MQRRSHGHICSAAERASSSPVVTVTEKASAGTLAPHVTPPSSFAAASNGGPSTAAKDRSPISARQGNSAGGGAGGPGGGGEEEASDSYQIGLDAFSQQALLSALTAGAAAAIARVAGLDLGSCLRLDLEALGLALELSAPVLVLLLVVSVPRWAPPFKAGGRASSFEGSVSLILRMWNGLEWGWGQRQLHGWEKTPCRVPGQRWGQGHAFTLERLGPWLARMTCPAPAVAHAIVL